MKTITSWQNPQIKALLKLKKTRERSGKNLIIIEGRHEISLALEAGLKLEKVYLCPSFASDENFKVKVENCELIQVNEEVFKKISYRENPDGYLALAEPKTLDLESIRLGKNPLIVILEAVEKPGNIGAILRTADAVGADLVIINNAKTDIFNPNIIRSSLGTVFTNKLVLANIKNTQKWLKKHGVSIFGTTPHTKTVYTEANFRCPSAIIIGSEHSGLSSEWLSLVDEKISIPMHGKIDSLNASVSAAVVLFEAIRQRSQH